MATKKKANETCWDNVRFWRRAAVHYRLPLRRRHRFWGARLLYLSRMKLHLCAMQP